MTASGTFGKTTKERTPYCHASFASATMLARLWRSHPGIDAIATFELSSWINSG